MCEAVQRAVKFGVLQTSGSGNAIRTAAARAAAHGNSVLSLEVTCGRQPTELRIWLQHTRLGNVTEKAMEQVRKSVCSVMVGRRYLASSLPQGMSVSVCTDK